MKRRDFIKLLGGACAIPTFSVARSQEKSDAPVASGFWLMTAFWPIQMASQIGAPFLGNLLPAAL